MSEEFMPYTVEEEQPKRPKGLQVLCILTFISTGLGLLSGIGRLVSGPMSAEAIEEERVKSLDMVEEFRSTGMDYVADLFNQLQHMMESVNAHFYPHAVLTLVQLILGLIGAYFMFSGKKLGFHFYIIYCLLSVGILFLFVSPVFIPAAVVIWDLIISGVFVFLYARHLHWMR